MNSSSTTRADLQGIGMKTLDEIQAITLYTPRYKGNHLRKHDNEVCKDTGGDCFKFVMQFLDMYWI